MDSFMQKIQINNQFYNSHSNIQFVIYLKWQNWNFKNFRLEFYKFKKNLKIVTLQNLLVIKVAFFIYEVNKIRFRV